MKVTRRTGSLVIVLVIFAAIVLGTALAAFAIDKSEIPMLQQHAAEAAAVTADGYTHGSNVKNNTTATAVSSPSDLVSKIQSSTTIRLTSDIDLSSNQVKQIWNTTYSGTLYGNGHTITVEFPSTGNAASVTTSTHKSAYGGLVGKLTGAIYDLKFVHTGGQLNVQMSGNNSGFAGGLVGSVEGGTIENVRVELSNESGGRVGFAKSSSGSDSVWGGSTNYYVAAGAMAGRIYSGTVKNVTVVNNAWIEAGVYSGSGTGINTKKPGHVGNIAGIIGPVQDESWSGSVTMDNIIVEGTVSSAELVGQWTTNLGAVTTSSLNITVTNFYNKFGNTFNSENNGSSVTFAKADASPTLSVTNLYKSANATTVSSSANISGNNTVTIPNNAGYSIYFDPKATNTSESLVVVKSGVTGGANYTATITGASNNSYSDGYYAFNSTGDTVVFRNLPTAASNWSSGGNFTCTITTTRTEIQVPTYDDLTKWEHGYVSADTTTSGTEEISTGTQFEKIFRPNGTLIEAGTYYLTEDIVITGFTGKKFGGTLDGNGHTIFITDTHTGMTGPHIGGLVGTLSGTIKNVRVVLMLPDNTEVTCTNGKGDDFVIGFGGVVGKINGGTVENVNVVIPSGYTFSAGWSGSGSDVGVGGIAGSMIGSGTVTNCTVQVDGDIRASSGWPFASGIVGATGKEQNYNEYPFRFTNIILKGIGTIGGTTTDSSNTTQPTFAAAITITPPITGNAIKIDGFIYNMTRENGPTWGSGGGAGSGNGKVSSWGYVCQNDEDGRLTAGVGLSAEGKISYSNIYDMGSLMYDTVAENGFTSGGDLIWHDTDNHDGNVYYNMTRDAEIKSTVAESTIPVTPYFPASSNGNLVLVAGDGTVTVPDLRYTNNAGKVCDSTADGNYKVVTVEKSKVDTTTVTLEEPITPAKPIDDLNQWENGYVASPQTGDEISATDLRNAINNNDDIILYNDIKDFVGFTHTGTYTGTLDGNGRTIYIVRDGGASGTNIGGLFSTLTGTVKNLRLVITTGADRSNTKYLGGIAGALDESAIVENVFVAIPAGVNLVTTRSGRDVGGVGGIAGGLINGSGDTVSISNTTVELQGTLKATAYWTFVGGFVGHLNGESDSSKGAINYTNTTFKGHGFLDGVANSGEGVHTAALGIVGGNVSAVNVDGVINSFNGTLSSGRSAYAIIVRNNLSLTLGNGITLTNVYTSGTVTTYNGEMTYGKPVNPSDGIKVISTTVSGDSIPVTPYFPASSNGNLVLVAGNGKDSFTTPVAYNNDTKSFVSEAVTVEVEVGEESITYQVVTVAKENVTTDPVSLEIAEVNNPVITTTDLTYKGQNGIDVTIGALQCGSSYELKLGKDYSITIAAVAGGTGFVGTTGKPVNAGEYTLTVTLTKHIFADESTVKVLNFKVSPAKQSVNVSIDGWTYGGQANKPQIEGIQESPTTTVSYSGTTNADTNNLYGPTDVVPEEAGTYTVTVSWDETTNYTAGSVKSAEFTIAKASLTDDTTDFSTVYDGAAHGLNIVLSGFVNNETMETAGAVIQYSANGQDNWTAVAITAEDYAATPVSVYYKVLFNNYETVTGNHSISISKKGIDISITADNREYDGTTNVTLSGGKLSGVVSGDKVTANLGTGFAAKADVGTGIEVTSYSVTLTGNDAHNYFISSYPKLTVTISAKEIAVSWSNYELTYNGKAQLPVASADGVNGETVKLTVAVKDGDSAVNAGDYTAVASTDNKNYSLTDDEREFSIAAKTVDFSAAIADGAKLVYGTVPEDFNSLVDVTASGGINLSAEDWSFAVTPSVENGEYTAKTPAGTTVTLTVKVSVTSNYTAVQPAKLELTVQKKPVAVTANDVNEIYGDTFLPDGDANGYFGKYFTVDGAPITDLNKENSVVTITVSGFNQTADILNAGDYTVSVTVLGNHYIESVNDEKVSDNSAVINYNVAPKELSFTTAENLSFLFADTTRTAITDQNLTAGNTYSVNVTGFVEADPPEAKAYTLTVSKVSGTLTYVQDNTDSHNKYLAVGTYIVRLSPVSKNYTFGSNNTNTFTFNVTKNEFANTWTSQDEIDDYPFGFEGKPVTGTAKFGTATITYYLGDVKGQADKGDAIEFSFGPREEDADTYTAVVSVAANGNNYDEISYEYTFVVKKHRLNITELKIFGTEESGTEVSGSATDGFTVTYAPDMGLSATVKVGSAEGYAGNYSELLGDLNTRTYLFEYSVADSNVWADGFPQSAGNYDIRFKGMELAAGYNIDNFEFVSVPSSVKLTIDPAKITVTAYIPENAAVVYGMTTDEIRNLIKLDPEEGVTLGEVKVTYDNGTEYNNTVAAGKKLTISVVSVKAENKNYIAEFVGGVLTPIVQQATLHVDAEDSSVLSANFDPDEFNEFKMYDAITAKWNGKIVTASDYFDVTLTGYKGEVTGMTAEENFANKEIGTYTFTVTLKDDYAVNFVTDPETIVYKLTLGQSIVTLTVSIGNWTYGGTAAKPTFTVTASDGTPIDILTIGQYITINYSNDSGYDSPDQPTDAGTYTLTANIVGHHDYVAENVATAKFTISPAEVKFGATLAEGAKLVYGIVPKDFNSLVTVTASGGINLGADGWGYTVTAAGDYTATTNAGTTVTLTVKFFVTDPNHTTVQPDKTLALEIQKAEQSVDVSIDGWTYGGQAKEPDIDGIKENAVTTVTYSGTTNAGEEYDSTTAPKKAGKYTLTVSWKETKNYTAGKAEPVAFTVEKAKLTKPTANGNTFTYTGAAQTYTPEGFDPDTMTIAGNVQTNAGKYTVTVSVTDNYNYVWAEGSDTDVEFTFVIGKAAQSVTVKIDGWTYGETAKGPDIDGIKESADTTAFYSGRTNAGTEYSSTTAPTAAGTYTVTVSWAETTNYTAGSVESAEFTVEKAKLTKPSANVDPFVYTGAAQTYTPDGFDSDTMTISGNVQTNADTYTVTVSVTDKYNYVWADDTDTDITFNFVIGKAEQSVNVTISDWTYGDTAKDYEIVGIMENADYTVKYSGDGYSADTAPVNAGNYTLTITVDATANYNAAVASAEFAIDPKELHVSDSVMIIEAEYGELTLDDISSDEAILAVIGDYTAIFDGLVYDDVLTPDDFTLTAAEDYSDNAIDGFMVVQDYSIKVALNDSLTNYVVPESGLENITFRVVKAANSIGRYSVSDWTYLDVRSEYIPAFSAAKFGTVVGSFFDENGTEIAVDDFGATTPAGTYTFRLSVAETDNYTGATRTGSFVVDKRIVVAELTATDVTYDGAVYDGISYTLSFDVSDYIGTVGYEYSENGSAFRKGLPTDAGNYSVRIGEYSDSENIELRAETISI